MSKCDNELYTIFKPYGGFGTRCVNALMKHGIFSIDSFIAADSKELKAYMNDARNIGPKCTNIVFTVYNTLKFSENGNSEFISLVQTPDKTSMRTFNLKEAQQYYVKRYNEVIKQIDSEGHIVFREEYSDWDHIRKMACHLNGVCTVSKIPDENLPKTIAWCKAITDLYFDFNNNSKPD